MKNEIASQKEEEKEENYCGRTLIKSNYVPGIFSDTIPRPEHLNSPRSLFLSFSHTRASAH